MTNRLRAIIIGVALAAAAPAFAQVPDLAPWDGVWLKTKIKQKGLAFRLNAPGVEKDSGAIVAYLQLHFDALEPDRLTVDVWVREDAWERSTLPLLYLAGTGDDLVVYLNQVPVSPDPVVEPILHLGFALRLQGKIAGGAVGKGSVKSLGAYFVEIDDVQGSDQRFAGSMTFKGKTTTKLPTDLPVQ